MFVKIYQFPPYLIISFFQIHYRQTLVRNLWLDFQWKPDFSMWSIQSMFCILKMWGIDIMWSIITLWNMILTCEAYEACQGMQYVKLMKHLTHMKHIKHLQYKTQGKNMKYVEHDFHVTYVYKSPLSISLLSMNSMWNIILHGKHVQHYSIIWSMITARGSGI